MVIAWKDDNLEILRLLLAAGPDTKARDSFGRIALHYAAASGDIGILRGFILEPDANMFAKDERGSTPFDFATSDSKQFLFEVFCDKMTQDHGRLALHAILGPAKFLFEDEYFHPPLNLHLQIKVHLGMLSLENLHTLLHTLDTELIRNRDDIGKLPIHIACQANAPVEVLSMLVEIDPATLQIADHDGALPIHCLLLSGSGNGTPTEYASVQYLVEQGGVGTLTARTTSNDFLPLHAYLHGSTLPHLRIVQYLIQSFPGSVAAQTTAGQYPFMMAACETSSASLSVVYELVRTNPAVVIPREL